MWVATTRCLKQCESERRQVASEEENAQKMKRQERVARLEQSIQVLHMMAQVHQQREHGHLQLHVIFNKFAQWVAFHSSRVQVLKKAYHSFFVPFTHYPNHLHQFEKFFIKLIKFWGPVCSQILNFIFGEQVSRSFFL